MSAAVKVVVQLFSRCKLSLLSVSTHQIDPMQRDASIDLHPLKRLDSLIVAAPHITAHSTFIRPTT
jgi:hypothetical protein